MNMACAGWDDYNRSRNSMNRRTTSGQAGYAPKHIWQHWASYSLPSVALERVRREEGIARGEARVVGRDVALREVFPTDAS
jgi:hypothetical protein